jgi:hypothetical protein
MRTMDLHSPTHTRDECADISTNCAFQTLQTKGIITYVANAITSRKGPTQVDTQISLKLGPGLLQVSSGVLLSAQDPTRARTLHNGKRWGPETLHILKLNYASGSTISQDSIVYAKHWRVCD